MRALKKIAGILAFLAACAAYGWILGVLSDWIITR